MIHVLLDALLDALKLFPFLILLYILIELLEHKTRIGKPNRALSGKFAPLIGSATGLVPMCGFSVMAAKLYERRYLTLGTLLSVLIATSDEAFLVLLLSSLPALSKLCALLALCGGKLLLGAGVGYLCDLFFRKRGDKPAEFAEDHEGHDHDGHDHEEEPNACEHRHGSVWHYYVLSPLWHAFKVTFVVFLFNFCFGAIFFAVGEENVLAFLQGAGFWYQPLLCSLIGMFPNCASSVILAEAYAIGGIAFGSLFGGLVTNAGLGVLVLFRNVKAMKRNFGILAATLILGVAAGYLVNLILL